MLFQFGLEKSHKAMSLDEELQGINGYLEGDSGFPVQPLTGYSVPKGQP